MNLDRRLFDQYLEKGWTVVEGVYSASEADRIAEIALAISQKEVQTEKKGYKADLSPNGVQLAPRKIDVPFWKESAFRAFVLDPRLLRLLEDLIGGKPLLVTDQIFMKPPRFGSSKPYHQDNFYFQCKPADKVVTAWIALDDVEAANGCLRYIDGSHRGPLLPHAPVPGETYNLVPPPELIDLSRESLAPVRKGGVVFHHSMALHTSHRNESDRWRRGYATHWATAEVTSANDTIPKAYFHRPDYSR
ncbi:MAG: phytanoyl-CoA dioxygenase family protein [Planctomycetes bacterium]|nr:phytanoyl-CoA dioxygenase family protein [Planctomycetota bacterium]